MPMPSTRTTNFRSLLLIGLLLLGVSVASADTIVESWVYFPLPQGTFQDTPWPDGSAGHSAYTISVPQFDSTLGLLKSVTLDMLASIQSSFTVTNTTTSGNNATIKTLDATMDVSIVNPTQVSPPYDGNLTIGSNSYVFASPVIIAVSNKSLAANANLYSTSTGGTSSTGPAQNFSATNEQTDVYTLSSDMAPFQHAGGGTYTLPVFATADLTTNIIGGNVQLQQNTAANIALLVSYDYEAGVTPEPAAFFLFGTGLIALGLMKRKKKA